MVAAAIVATPTHAPVGTTVTVNGTNFVGVGDTIVFTYGGVAPTIDNVSGQVVALDGSFLGTFVVPETDAAGNPVALEATDAPGADDCTFDFNADASFTMTPSHAKVGTALVAVAGHAYTNGDTMQVFTFGGVQPATQTVAGVAVVGVDGTFTGTFTVPAGSGIPHAVVATDNSTVTATENFNIDPAISFVPGTGSEDDVITVAGSGFTNTKHITAFTVAGIGVALTPTAPVIGVTGAWTGTFPVPNEPAGVKAVVATSNAPESATANFTIAGGSMAPDGKQKATAGAANHITLALTTSHDQDFVIGVVAWEDTVGTDKIGVISDVAGLTWSLRGKTVIAYDGVSKYFYVQKFYAYAPVALEQTQSQ